MWKFFRRAKEDHEWREEMETHVQMLTERFLEQGAAPEAARTSALKQMGNLTVRREEIYRMNSILWIDVIVTDLHYALRELRKHAGFASVAVLMLAAGIGVNVMVFSIVNTVLFKGFSGVRENNRLVYMSSFEGCCVSYPDFLDWREQARSFQGMEITHGIQAKLGDENPERYDATELSAGTFSLVGRRPLLGRDFAPADEWEGAPPVAILQYDFWRRRFNRDPTIIGRRVRINSASTQIIGVMPEGFLFPQKNEMWVPLVKAANVMKRENRQTWMVIGRLRDRVTMGTARAEMQAIAARLEKEHPETNQDIHVFVETFTEFMWGKNSTVLYGTLWGAVTFVLLIACANVANLMLARAVNRSREISLQMALGANRARIVQKLLFESLIVAAMGGLVGLGVARLGLMLFVSAASRSAWMSWIAADFSLDRQALFYTIAVSVCTGLLFGIAPAFRLASEDVNTALKDGSRGALGTGHGRRLSSLLVLTETALAVVLLAGAGVMVRSFLKLHNADIGVETEHIVSFNLEWPDSKRLPPTEESVFYDGLISDLGSVPGMRAASLARPLPSEPAGPELYEIDGKPGLHARAARILIAPSYFRAVGASIVAGRDFSPEDRTAKQAVALVNERLASEYWPGQTALGKRIRLAGRRLGSGPVKAAAPEWRIIVGIVSNIKQEMTKPGFLPLVYVPYLSNEERGANVVARTDGPPERLIAPIRQTVQKAAPALTIWRLEPLEATLRRNYWKSQFYGTLFLSFAGVALLLAATGLYAVMALEVSRRQQEIGVRIAVGGSAGAVFGLVLRQAMMPVVAGLVAGLALALDTNRVLQGQLVQVSPNDPLTMVLAALALLAAALVGCVVPACRAIGIDPTIALRNE